MKSRKGEKWTQREIDKLEDMYYEYPVKVIANKLRRTVRACYIKYSKL